MDVQTIFKRYELKYLLTKEQKDRLLEKLQENLIPDPHGETTIRNIYFDTENYQLIRRSLENRFIRKSCGFAATARRIRTARCLWS